MELYIGGISQGKLQYVCDKKKFLKDSAAICDGAVCSMEEIVSKQIINHFHLFLRRFFTEEMNPGFNSMDNSKGNSMDISMDTSTGTFVDTSMDTSMDTSAEPQKQAAAFIEVLIARNPSAVIICNEVGYGIVPMDKTDRIYRETVGRCLCRLAEYSTSVERIVCGLGMKIK